MKPSINLRYKSLLLTCLLILSAGAVAPAWGQTYTINYKNGYGVCGGRGAEGVVYSRVEV